VNWCPRCQTAISDLEVVHEEQQGKLYEIRYPLANGTEYVTIATTRPETMLGDVAVVVNPADARYLPLHGKRLRLPLTNREIPILPDEWANPEFGTGAVKVTPAHDPNDFAIAERHKFPLIVVMDETAHMNAEAGVYAGLDRYEARKRILADLDQQGLLVAVKDYVNSIGKCERCKTVVEPRLSMQWFIRIQPLADKAIKAVETGAIRFTPEQYKKTYFEWMRNIHDWCISRQLWWGHRIPAWHCANCREITVARETPAACSHCGSSKLTQETDVLDTWFSSGLLPFTVFGWPAQTPDLAAFYPTQLLVTGFDILFFWVARMIMLGCHFMLDVPMPDGSKRTLTDAVPFREVYIHALVRDADRQKMSKTKGNVVDPIEIIHQYGTDAVRFTLASMASPGTDIAFSEARTEGYRAFANKIWNAARFIFMQMERAKEAGIVVDLRHLGHRLPLDDQAPLEEQWIVSRFTQCASDVNHALTDFRFDDAANRIYQFFWGEFCDWYLEVVKIRLDYGEAENKATTTQSLATLLGVFEASLRLLSPFMPFLTEEIWTALYDGAPPLKSIALARFPGEPEAGSNEVNANPAAVDLEMFLLQEIIADIRNLRKEQDVPEKESAPIFLTGADNAIKIVRNNQEMVQRLARVSGISYSKPTVQGLSTRHGVNYELALHYERQIDVAAERERVGKDLARFEKEMESKQKQLQNEGFLAKAPSKVVEGLRARSEELKILIEKAEAALRALESLEAR
jgi:valyl-tRNA synthetase